MNKIKFFALSSLLITGFACSQKTDVVKMGTPKTDKSLIVEADSAAIAEAKKKAAAEEKAKLPKRSRQAASLTAKSFERARFAPILRWRAIPVRAASMTPPVSGVSRRNCRFQVGRLRGAEDNV